MYGALGCFKGVSSVGVSCPNVLYQTAQTAELRLVGNQKFYKIWAKLHDELSLHCKEGLQINHSYLGNVYAYIISFY